MFIDGIGIGGYRSFGEMQYLAPFQKINLFIGKNNSGKSNILKFIFENYPSLVTVSKNINQKVKPLSPLDRHKGKTKKDFLFALGININGEKYNSLASKIQTKIGEEKFKQMGEDLLEKTFNLFTPAQNKDTAWINYSVKSETAQYEEGYLESLVNDSTSSNLNLGSFLDLFGQTTGDIKTNLARILLLLQGTISPQINVEFIPAFRKIGNPKSTIRPKDRSGEGWLSYLADIQNPDYDSPEKEEQYNKINDFLKIIINNKSAQIKIPENKRGINVTMDGLTLPLESLGTGVHEVIVLSTICTFPKNQIVCIEEPELHLHPLMVKKLMHYLTTETENQYFITTHSNHLLDTSSASIFHVELIDGQTEVNLAVHDKQKFSICSDLGYKASDLLQANCIIWVEGPSDKIYLNHWISSIEPSFIEGTHYSIMFYGGSVLFHLSADDPDEIGIENDFISLRKLNRNISIHIDSDKKNKGEEIGIAKKRVGKEINKGSGIAWITQGRTIENYLNADLLKKAVKKSHPTLIYSPPKDEFDDPLNLSKSKPNKVKIAHNYVELDVNPDLGTMDLKDRVNELIEFIKKANGSEET